MYAASFLKFVSFIVGYFGIDFAKGTSLQYEDAVFHFTKCGNCISLCKALKSEIQRLIVHNGELLRFFTWYHQYSNCIIIFQQFLSSKKV